MIKKLALVLCFLLGSFGIQAQTVSRKSLTKNVALVLVEKANKEAQLLNKEVSIAVLDASGIVILLLKGDQVGPHNTEASRRKAYTALSTKTPSYILMKKARESEDAKNLNTLPELLLLGGGVPIWDKGELIGSIGISGGGSGKNDHLIATKAIESAGYSIEK